MARKEDKGDYLWDNVDCITAEENHARYNRARKQPTSWRRPISVDTARAIFVDERPYQEIASAFGVNKNAVHRIKTRVAFARVTGGLIPVLSRQSDELDWLDELCPCCRKRFEMRKQKMRLAG